MAEDCEKVNKEQKRRAVLNWIAWGVIAFFVILTACFMVWASHQPRTHSMWGSPEDDSQ